MSRMNQTEPAMSSMNQTEPAMSSMNRTEPAMSSMNQTELAMFSVDQARNYWLTDEEKRMFETVNYVFLCGAFSLFGIVTNVINLLVFYRQGLGSTMNISFFSLAIAEICSLQGLFTMSLFFNPLVENSDIPLNTKETFYLISSCPYITFYRTTCLIMVYVTAERCICIVFPLKVKTMITPKRTTVTMVSMYVFSIALAAPEYATTYYDWKFYPGLNVTKIGIYFKADRKALDSFDYYAYMSVNIVTTSFVFVFTSVLIVKLRHNAKWRLQNSNDIKDASSIRDRKAMKMVMLISSILILSSIPNITLSLINVFVSEFTIFGIYQNIFFVAWSFSYTLGAVNSCVTIVLYYNMSTKYRQTFHEIFNVR